MEHTRSSATLEAAARLLKRIGIEQFIESIRGKDCGDYRMQTRSEG